MATGSVESTPEKGDPKVAGIPMSTDAGLGLAGTTGWLCFPEGGQHLCALRVPGAAPRERGILPTTTGRGPAVVKSTELGSAIMFMAKL